VAQENAAGGVEFEITGVVAQSWDQALCAVVVQWQGGATARDFHSLLAAETAALKRHFATKLLTDCRLQRPLPEEAQDAADRDWLPAAAGAGLRHFAVVLPKDRDAAVNLMDRLGRTDNLEVRFFESLDAATAWLAGVDQA
jgi:hypothetical protein